MVAEGKTGVVGDVKLWSCGDLQSPMKSEWFKRRLSSYDMGVQ